LKPKPFPPKITCSDSKKLDLIKVRRSGINVWKATTNNKGQGKDVEHPIDIDGEDVAGKGHANADVADKSGSCLSLLRKIDTVIYGLVFNVMYLGVSFS
jgi:hypothetical protein